ncbi:hypothetical protein MXB_5357 [Myxobolus squamalis]|nr:hypothetical protein MXB_5357 [Myxobolus squamalis]
MSESAKTSKSIQKKIKIKHAKSLTKDKSHPKITLLLHQMSQILRETSDIPVPAVFLSDDFKSSVKMSIDFHVIYNNTNFLPMYVGLCRIFSNGKYAYVIIMKNPIHTPLAEKVDKQTFIFSNKEADKDGFGAEIANLNFPIPLEAHEALIQRLSKDIEFLGSHSIHKLTVQTKWRKYAKKLNHTREDSASDCESPESEHSVDYFSCDPAYSTINETPTS